jgi:hypothetical protein
MEIIKTITLAIVLIFIFGCACPDTKTSREYPSQKIKGETKSYTIYKHNSIIPEYEVRNGKVYKPGGLMPLYEIRDSKVYKPGGLMPLYEFKEDKGFKVLVD